MKTDPKLGKEVFDMLAKKKLLGAQSPMYSLKYSAKHAQESIIEHFEQILDQIGLDGSDESIAETPKRIGKMYVEELFVGMDPENFPKCTTTLNSFQADELVCESGISVKSLCEHHFQAIIGTATVAYIPNDKLLGLSKLNRIVHFFARRPQVQERLTEQVYHTLSHILKTSDVAVIIKAAHMCVKLRGVGDDNCITTTSKMGGRFRSVDALRAELFSLAR